MIDESTVMHETAETAIARGRAVTADGLFRMPDDGYRYALVRGELQRMSRLPVEEIFAL